MTLEQCTVSSGLIIPDNIPGPDLKPGTLEGVAETLRTAGTDAVTHAETAESSWAGLPAVLESPEGPTIYAALGTPSTTASTISTKFTRVAEALEEFASRLGAIKDTFAAIKADAVEFRATITADERVWVSPGETKEYEHNGLAVVSPDGYTTSYSTGSSQSEVLSYLRGRGESARVSGGQVQILAPWTESSEHIDQNNALMDRLADAYTTLQNAEADCANAINRQRDLCVADIEYIEAWELKQDGENTVFLPWGNRVQEDRNCGESFWWGVGSAGGEALDGLGTLIGRDPVSGNFSWEMAGQGWLGALQGIGTLLVITSPPLQILGRAGVPVLSDAVEMGDEMVKGLLAWDTWSENPAEAAGRVVFNVGTLFIPGAGEISAGVKALTAGARVADVATDAARLTDAATTGLARVDGLAVRLDGLAGDAAGAANAADNLVPALDTNFRLPDIDLVRVADDVPASPAPVGAVDPVVPVRPRPGDDLAPPVRPQDDPVVPVRPPEGGPTPPMRPHVDDPTPPVRPPQDAAPTPVRPPDDTPPIRPGDDATPPVRPDDSTPPVRPDDSTPPVRPDDDSAPPVRPDDDAAPPVRPDGEDVPPTRPGDDDVPPDRPGDDGPPTGGGDPPAGWPPRDVPDDHWSRDPAFNDPSDPVVWFNEKYDTALTASQRAAADDYLQFSSRVAPDITDALQRIENRHPDAELAGLQYALKGEDSFYRKLATDMQDAIRDGLPLDVPRLLGDINDSVRYTYRIDDAVYTQTTTALIDDLATRFELVTVKNFWQNSEGYVGINATFRDASGRLFEVQFHTPTSFVVKNEITHAMYEEARLPGTTAARKLELEQLQNAEFAQVPHPVGSSTIPGLARGK